MDKIDSLSNFLEENFPEKAEEMRETLNELKEVMLSTNLEISESMTDIMLDNEYNKARNFIDKSEDISNYIKKLEDIIELISHEGREEANINNEEEVKEEKELEFEMEKEPEISSEDTDIYIKEESEPLVYEDKEDEIQAVNESEEEVIEEINTRDIRKQTEQETSEDEEASDTISAQEISQMFEEREDTYNNQANNDNNNNNNNNVHYLDENFREKEPSAFYIGEEGKEVKSWSDMLVETCKMLKDRDPDKFVAFINDDDFKFISRSYFSYNKDQIKEPAPMQLKNRKIYIETKLSPNVVNKLIQKLVNKYGIEQKSYKIYYQDDKSITKEGKKIS